MRFLVTLFHLFVPPMQEYVCINDHPIRERRRKPCPSCGSLNRVLGRNTEDEFIMKDKAG